MPENRFNGFTDYGIGIGLRAPRHQHILSRKPVVDWFEIISENFMIDGGRPLHILDQILDQYNALLSALHGRKTIERAIGATEYLVDTCSGISQ